MIHSGYVDWDFARIAEAFNAAPPTDSRHRAIWREQRLADRRSRQDARLRTQRDHAGMPVEAAHRLMARSERLARAVTYDPIRNNAVIADPALAATVRCASHACSCRAWALVDSFCRSRIPASRALVVPAGSPLATASVPTTTPPSSPASNPGQPPVPQDRGVFILVEGLRVKVSRYRQIGAHNTYDVEHALNWAALEPDALLAVEAVGGAYWIDDHYPCPPELAARAQF